MPTYRFLRDENDASGDHFQGDLIELGEAHPWVLEGIVEPVVSDWEQNEAAGRAATAPKDETPAPKRSRKAKES